MEEKEMKKFTPPAELHLFFKRLKGIKDSIKNVSESHENETVQLFAASIYQELHKLYKTEKEHENSDCTSSCNDA